MRDTADNTALYGITRV